MSLQIWLPFTDDLTNNQGLANVTPVNHNVTSNTSCKLGACANFNGTNAYVNITNYSFSNLPAFSVAFWCYSTTSTLLPIFQIKTGPGTVAFQFSDASTIAFRDNMHSTLTSVSVTPPTAQTWTHYVFVYDRGNWIFYKDGVQDGPGYVASQATTFYPSSTVFYVGRKNTTAGDTYYNGRLNDFRVYDHALSVKEVSELSKGLMIHYKLDNGGLGQENLLLDSHTSVSTGLYQMHNYYFVTGEEPVEGETYTIQLKGQLGEGKTQFGIYNSGGSVTPASLYPANQNEQGIYTKTFTWRTGTAANTFLRVYQIPSTVSATSTIEWIKLEKGSVATPWTPNHADADYSALNLNAQLDCSGYAYNASTNAVTHSADTARYGCSSVFDGSQSYVKTETNAWMANGMPAFTINLWAKASTWASGTHFFSCTESGGFNTEAGNSGYLRFPIYVYTNSAQTTQAYKFDSQELKLSDLPTNEWVMLTWEYDSTGTRTYINGELHHTYTNTSYGVKFNTNARLFLGCEASTATPTTPYFNGQMSDFRLYTTILTEEDLRELYQTSACIDKQGGFYSRELVE